MNTVVLEVRSLREALGDAARAMKTGRAEGTTAWTADVDKPKPNGDAALVMLQLDYRHPSGRTDLKESRTIRISRPSTDGSYSIDWRADFVAGSEGALLDRTPMPGEADGKVNGGYAGLGVRFAPAPLEIAFVTSAGPIDKFVDDPVAVMKPVNAKDPEPPIWKDFRRLLEMSEGRRIELTQTERFEFYEKAEAAFCVVATSDSALYANIILKKGVVVPKA